MSAKPVFIPGQTIGPLSSNNVGFGTHIQDAELCASIAGPLQSGPPGTSIARLTGPLLPSTGAIILGKITRTTPRQAHVAIVALGAAGEHVCRDPFPAVIRQQDIRATEIDRVRVPESFRTGDVVRAVVISLGDERSYYLSTARNDLGVVLAQSEWGNPMFPISWREFQDPKTGLTEARKVAKPV